MKLRLLLTVLLAAPLTAQRLYDEGVVRSVELTFHQTNYQQLLTANYTSKTYIPADLTFDGIVYKDVGVRYRGNSSYKAVPGIKKPFKISMDEFVSGRRLMGFRTLNLNNGFRDPTFVREVLSFWLLRRWTPAPRCNWVTLKVNGQSRGIYINVEQINKDFLDEWFVDNDGNRYRGERQSRAAGSASALIWLGNDPNSYKTGYELKTSTPTNPWVDIMTLCGVLNNSGAQLAQRLPTVLDVDGALRYLAGNNILPAVDSYIGGNAHNYYLFNDLRHGRFSLFAWDLNASFGGNSWLTPFQKQNLSPFYFETRLDRPLLNKVMAVPAWRARYIAHLRAMLGDSYEWTTIGAMVTSYQNLIRPFVQADTLKLYSMAMFTNNVTTNVQLVINGRYQWIPGLKPMVDNRRRYLLNRADIAKAPPVLSDLKHNPAQPSITDTVWVTARVGAQVVASGLNLWQRNVGAFQSTKMYDDGNHGDGAAGDGVWGASIAKQSYGTLIEYYVSATAVSGSMSFAPTFASHRPGSYRVHWPRRSDSMLINEFLALNTRTNVDEKGEFEDWIEFHNPRTSTIDMSGMYLTDDLSIPTRWQIPNGTTIAPGATLLVWADDEPREGPMHATFKLNKGGEEIGLFAPDGITQLDAVVFGNQAADISTGRLYDGKHVWVTFAEPTPAVPNVDPNCGVRTFSALDPNAHDVALALSGAPKLKTTPLLQLRNASANSPFALFTGTAGINLQLTPELSLLLAPPFGGPIIGTTSTTGTFDLPLPIPDIPALVNLSLYWQTFVFTSTRAHASNALEMRFCR